MRHLVSGRKLKRTSSHRRALMKNLATALFEHKKITTTEAKAKELRPYAEKIISRAKRALQREKAGNLPAGQKIDIHSRRVAARLIQSKAVLQELFDTIAPMVVDRPGGYTRIIKTGFRRGDGGKSAIIELVDWSAPQDGAASTKKRRTGKAAPAAGKPKTPPTGAVTGVKGVEDQSTLAPAEEEIIEAPATEEMVDEQAAETIPAAEPTPEATDVAEGEIQAEASEENPEEEKPEEEKPAE